MSDPKYNVTKRQDYQDDKRTVKALLKTTTDLDVQMALIRLREVLTAWQKKEK